MPRITVLSDKKKQSAIKLLRETTISMATIAKRMECSPATIGLLNKINGMIRKKGQRSRDWTQ